MTTKTTKKNKGNPGKIRYIKLCNTGHCWTEVYDIFLFTITNVSHSSENAFTYSNAHQTF